MSAREHVHVCSHGLGRKHRGRPLRCTCASVQNGGVHTVEKQRKGNGERWRARTDDCGTCKATDLA
jgi:hypothetical protein